LDTIHCIHGTCCASCWCTFLQVKILTRRAFDEGQLSGAELVQLMHGLARMPRYAPNQGWLAAAAKATQHHLQDMTPGE
jgi:hypothetical protein